MFASYLDAARSRAITKELLAPLSELRAKLNADVSYVLFQRPGTVCYDVVSADCMSGRHAFLKGETISIQHELNRHLPRSFERLELVSELRHFSNALASALVVPWRHPDGQAWLLVGNFSVLPSLSNVYADTAVLDLLEAVKRSYLAGTLRGSQQLDKLFADSVKRLLEAEQSFDTTALLNAITSIARWMFGTSAAYVALPSSLGDKYRFAATDRIRTDEFRHLSLGLDEGIGGLARRVRGPVRSTDYAQDSRLGRAPFRETMQEGFKSAACTPLWQDGRVNGLLYIAQRTYRVFNDIDLDLLERFANRSAEALTFDQKQQFHIESVKRAERERLANKLHDYVVRHLLDVGIAASMSSASTQEPTLRASFEDIQNKAQMCLDAVRDFIAEASAPQRSRPIALGALAAQLEKVPSTSGMTREIRIGHGCEPGEAIEPELADTLSIIAREALSNADRHSRGKRVRIRLDRLKGAIRLRIDDDGDGMDEARLGELLRRPGHLGLQRMRSLAQLHGGTCRLARSDLGGLSIDTQLPLL